MATSISYNKDEEHRTTRQTDPNCCPARMSEIIDTLQPTKIANCEQNHFPRVSVTRHMEYLGLLLYSGCHGRGNGIQLNRQARPSMAKRQSYCIVRPASRARRNFFFVQEVFRKKDPKRKANQIQRVRYCITQLIMIHSPSVKTIIIIGCRVASD